jgi:hypothetical protein
MTPISDVEQAARARSLPRRRAERGAWTADPKKASPAFGAAIGGGYWPSTEARPMDRADWSSFLIQAYILGIPIWWVLGLDFIVPQILSLALVCVALSAHRYFTLPDYLLAAIILTLGTTAYVNGFLLSQETMRFAAALYNLSLWVCGLIVLQQVRYLINRNDARRRALLAAGFWAFLLLAMVANGAFVLAYFIDRFSLVAPSLFGATLGHAVPPSAVIVEQSTRLVFTRADWGLPGVPMPRVTVYGPYPTATAAATAVLGTLALLYLQSVKRAGALVVLMVEGIVLLTLSITLTRSILAGWLVGALVANLLFGTGYRRLAACGAIAVALMLVAQAGVSNVEQYRAYSSESRFKNYVRAFNQTLTANPVLGLGFKPREEDNHIAVGSHSTLVSSFTKGGTLATSLVVAYLFVIPAFRWITVFGVAGPDDALQRRRSQSERRVLFNLQVAIWVWLCFEDIDAPATAATLIFFAFAFIEAAFRPARARLPDPVKSTVLSAVNRAT